MALCICCLSKDGVFFHLIAFHSPSTGNKGMFVRSNVVLSFLPSKKKRKGIIIEPCMDVHELIRY